MVKKISDTVYCTIIIDRDINVKGPENINDFPEMSPYMSESISD